MYTEYYMAIRKEIPLYDAEFHMTDDNNSPDNHAVLYQYDEETGQTSFDVVDHVHINSETPRIRQFQAESMGRTVVGLFSKKDHWGDMIVTTNRQKK
jgi:hypothetical protein